MTKLNCGLAKDLETRFGLPAAETYREIIRGEKDAELVTMAHRVTKSKKFTHLENRPRGRPFNQCFQNAAAEEKKTGNKACWGYATHSIWGHAQQSVIHAFNKDKDGKYYDTAVMPEGIDPRSMFVSVVADNLDVPDGTTDYYYIRTKGRVFRWTSEWGSDGQDATYEGELLVEGDRVFIRIG